MHARGLVHLAGVRSFVPPSLASRRPAPRAAMASASSTPARSDPGGPQRTIVSADWLRANLARVKVLDCSWYLPAMNRDAVAEFRARRLPGARYFDVDLVSDRASPLPHMLPSAAAFAAACDALGVANDDQIVVYDGAGLFSAARAWWMFKTFGHDAVAVLDGGAPAWDRAGGEWDETPLEGEDDDAFVRAAADAAARASQDPGADEKESESESAAASYKYSASLNPALVRSKAEVLANCVEQPSNNPERLVDARPEPRWRGRAPEPRPGIRSGRAPGSANVPFHDLLDPELKTLVAPAEIRRRFAEAGVDIGEEGAGGEGTDEGTDEGSGGGGASRAPTRIVASCGTGVTACVLSLAIAVAEPERWEKAPVGVYDGSWTEWGAEDSGCPVEKDEE